MASAKINELRPKNKKHASLLQSYTQAAGRLQLMMMYGGEQEIAKQRRAFYRLKRRLVELLDSLDDQV